MEHRHIPPSMDAKAFNCPHCAVYAKQEWSYFEAWRPSSLAGGSTSSRIDRSFRVSYCESCGRPTIWSSPDFSIVYPPALDAEPPSVDLPDELKRDYEEARLILQHSPRGAAALLRLVIQKLCVHLGQPGKNINADIKALVAAGLPGTVQRAMDILRVIGNEAVHPGQIDLNDNREVALKLFTLVNFIVHKMITEPREIEELYDSLPAEKIEAIAKRDGNPSE